MAFTSAISKKTIFGDLRVHFGTYTNTGGSTGGDITTGLKQIFHIKLQPTGSAVVANCPVINETLPLQLDGVTVVNTADEDGLWIAYGL